MNNATRTQLHAAMGRLADGDRAAFDDVYQALCPAVHAFCEKMLGRGADADDAAQQSMITLFSQASSFDAARDACAWALSIAAWQCRTARRKARRSREVELTDAHHEKFDRTTPSPEDLTIVRDLEEAATSVIGTLSVLDRETLLADFGGGARPEVAQSSFRKRKERALARLRDAWRRVHGS